MDASVKRTCDGQHALGRYRPPRLVPPQVKAEVKVEGVGEVAVQPLWLGHRSVHLHPCVALQAGGSSQGIGAEAVGGVRGDTH